MWVVHVKGACVSACSVVHVRVCSVRGACVRDV